MSEIQPYRPAPVGMSPMPPQPPLAAPGWAPAPATDRREQSGAVIAIAWVCAVLSFGYMLPWAIAATRGRSNVAAIGLINLLLGWSFIGWVVSLVMACQSHTPLMSPHVNVVVAQQFPHAQFAGGVPPVHVQPGPGWYPAPDGQGQQFWDGQAWTGHRAP